MAFFYNPYFALPIIQNDYKLNGLLNEYAELNDLSSKTNAIYQQNLINDCKNRSYQQQPTLQTTPIYDNSRRFGYYGPGYYGPGFYGSGYYNPYFSPWFSPPIYNLL